MAADKVKFKVGDRVEFIATTGSNGRLIGKRGVIAATYDDGYDWCIRLDEYSVSFGHSCEGVVKDGHGRYADSKDLRLVAEATSGKLESTAPTLDDLYAAKCMVETGVCTINEVRKHLGLGPVSRGHELARAA
jgi:hypothetical protein